MALRRWRLNLRVVLLLILLTALQLTLQHKKQHHPHRRRHHPRQRRRGQHEDDHQPQRHPHQQHPHEPRELQLLGSGFEVSSGSVSGNRPGGGDIEARQSFLEMAQNHRKRLTYEKTGYTGAGAPPSYGIPETPEKILIPELVFLFVQTWLNPEVEIEVRIGKLTDRKTNEKAHLNPRVKSILPHPPLQPRCKFQTGVQPKMFEKINVEVNRWVKQKLLPISYERTLEVDRVHKIINSKPGYSEHVRFTIDVNTGKVVRRHVKQRCSNIDLYWPGDHDLDLRVMSSYETAGWNGMEVEEWCEMLRKKNRITYHMSHFKVDLSETYSYPAPTEQQLRVLQAPRPTAWKKGQRVRVFSENRWKSGVVDEMKKSTILFKPNDDSAPFRVHKDSMALELEGEHTQKMKLLPEVGFEVEVELTTLNLTQEAVQAWYQCVRSLKHVAELVVNPNVKPSSGQTTKREQYEAMARARDGPGLDYFNETHSSMDDDE